MQLKFCGVLCARVLRGEACSKTNGCVNRNGGTADNGIESVWVDRVILWY